MTEATPPNEFPAREYSPDLSSAAHRCQRQQSHRSSQYNSTEYSSQCDSSLKFAARDRYSVHSSARNCQSSQRDLPSNRLHLHLQREVSILFQPFVTC